MLRDKYLSFTLLLLSVCGYSPYKKTKLINTIFMLIHFAATITLSALVILCIYINIRDITIEITSKLLESFGACMQVRMI